MTTPSKVGVGDFIQDELTPEQDNLGVPYCNCDIILL